MIWDAVDALMEEAIAERSFPGAVVGLGRGTEEQIRAFGGLTYGPSSPRVRPETLYDLASLTKVVTTTSLVMQLVESGLLDLEAAAAALLPQLAAAPCGRVTLRQLLDHSSGLPAHAQFFRSWSGREGLVPAICSLPLEAAPGSRAVYSDVGFLLLGEILERVLGEPLDRAARRRVFAPLGMRSTVFCPPKLLRPRIAPTEICPWRGRLLVGEVHDENAFVLGGVAAHAGLFGTAGDLLRFGRMLLRKGKAGRERLLSRETIRLFTERSRVPGSTRALGWDTADVQGAARSSTAGDPGYSSAGRRFSRHSFGHTGFSGTSLWIDPEREIALVLLTNRVHPHRGNDAIRAVRAQLADLID